MRSVLRETVTLGGRAAPFGVGGLACWPREWEPDPGREIGAGERLDRAPRPWEPDPGSAVGVGFGFHINVGSVLKSVASIAAAPEKLAAEAVKDPTKLLHDVVKVAGDVVKVDKFLLEQAAGIVSLVPGLGTAISTAIGAGLAALEGGSALDIAIKIAYAALPIPPGIRSFTDLVLGAVLDIVNAIVKGGDLLKMLERLIAEELSKALPSDVQAAGTQVLATLAPTVVAALTGHGLPALPAVPGVPALPKGPALKVPKVPGTSGALGDPVDDFTSQLQAQYRALNLPPSVRSATDPLVQVLVSMIHSLDVGPAILLAVRTGIASKLPQGVARDVGLHIFDTLAHLVLGHLFKGSGRPTQAKVSHPLTKAELSAARRAAALHHPLPATVKPIARTAAAYKPLAAAEKAESKPVTVPAKGPVPLPASALPPTAGVTRGAYGPYPPDATGAAAPAAPTAPA